MATEFNNVPDEFDGNAARNISPRKKLLTKEDVKKQKKLHKMTEKQIRTTRRKHIKPSSVVGIVCSVLIVGTLIVTSISAQVQINELTSEKNSLTNELIQLQSVEVQLQMQATSAVDPNYIRDFSEQYLGMESIRESQITYINMEKTDQATVYIEKNNNIFTKILEIFGFSL